MGKYSKKIKRGFFAGLKEASGVSPDMRFGYMQAGKLVGVFLCFLLRWCCIFSVAVAALWAYGGFL